MKKQDIQKLMDILKAAYPATYKQMLPDDMRATMSLYYDIFKGYSVQIVATALKNYIKTNKYPPTIAGLQEQIDMMVNSSVDELWTKMQQALSNGMYHSKEEYEKLPEVCKRFIGSPAALRRMSMTDAGTVDTVIKGQFLRQVRIIQQRTEAIESLPEDVRQMAIDKILQIGE